MVSAPAPSFPSFLQAERVRNAKRLRFAGCMAVLIALLFWQTQWLVLRPGLGVLLAGQTLVLGALGYRQTRLSSDTADRTEAWFDGQIRFVAAAGALENVSRLLGFILLGYEFWIGSRNVAVALLIGVIYPAVAYLGIARRNGRKILRDLGAEKKVLLL